MRFLALFILTIHSILAISQEKPAYQLFSKEGKKVKYGKMLNQLKEADVILFGELHDNPICHWLELELAKDIYKEVKEKLVLGAEMYESDNQIILDEYLSGLIKKKHFTTEAKVWNNNKDYQPLVDLAKTNSLKFIATNIPRRYANLVARKDLVELEKLTDEQKKYIAPLPLKIDLNIPAYKMFLDMGMGHGSEMTSEKMAKAQASKDATMAYFILKNWKEGSIFLHYNGAYHSDNFESIYWYLKQSNPDLNIVTISTVEQLDIETLVGENIDKASFIIAIPESMSKTY